ncbi:hypothetical protein CRUP_019861, partial [Coryphaenoides rupestris]
AKLKNNREVCINPETKWLQQYLKNAINNQEGGAAASLSLLLCGCVLYVTRTYHPSSHPSMDQQS